jgi:RHS repeat-associated protein
LKLTPAATHTFLYDGWNLIKETIQGQQSTTTNYFVWGKDLSDTLQGAGGVGGLLAVSLNGSWHFPLYDNNGNVTAYADESGNIVATYSYDAFGQTIAHSGLLADAFPHRFSTKLFDPETGLYYYGYRFYAPEMMRWMNRDPIGEQGGEPLYAYVSNEPISNNDPFGLTNEPRGYPPDPVWGLYSRLPPLSQIEEQEGYCGPDVTAALDATLVAVEAAYMVSDHKLAACCVLQGAYGYQRAANAWMINTLTGIGLANQYFDAVPEDQPINKESPNWKFYVKDHRLPLCHMRPGGGHRRCISTVTYRGRCYRATNLNFALFGKAVGLCHRNLGRPFLKAGFTILAAAIAKADQTRYPDIPQAVAVSVAFAFGGGMPLMATPGCAAAQEPNAAPVSYLDGWSWDYVRE